MGHKCCHQNHLNQNMDNLAFHQRRALLLALFVNTIVFICEVIGGLHAQSEAVLADSIHLFSHLFVIIISLIVLKKNLIWKARAAFVKGLLIAGLGLSILLESFSSLFFKDHLPEANVISAVASLALLGNALTIWILAKHRDEDLNMRSAWACSQADLLTNVCLIIAGFLVAFFHSGWPDSILGLFLGASITKSAINLLQQTRYQLR